MVKRTMRREAFYLSRYVHVRFHVGNTHFQSVTRVRVNETPRIGVLGSGSRLYLRPVLGHSSSSRLRSLRSRRDDTISISFVFSNSRPFASFLSTLSSSAVVDFHHQRRDCSAAVDFIKGVSRVLGVGVVDIRSRGFSTISCEINEARKLRRRAKSHDFLQRSRVTT
ncbi:hypothetical protein Rs2_18861 [Raphanus sativus]|nr:hypothetical protein Rs2_18861 [Raphanus sativus]